MAPAPKTKPLAAQPSAASRKDAPLARLPQRRHPYSHHWRRANGPLSLAHLPAAPAGAGASSPLAYIQTWQPTLLKPNPWRATWYANGAETHRGASLWGRLPYGYRRGADAVPEIREHKNG